MVTVDFVRSPAWSKISAVILGVGCALAAVSAYAGEVDYASASTDEVRALRGKAQLEPLVRYVVKDYMSRHEVADPLREEFRVQLILELMSRESEYTNQIDRHDTNGRGGTQTVYGYLQFLPGTYARMRHEYAQYVYAEKLSFPPYWDSCVVSDGLMDARCQVVVNTYAWGQGSLIREWGPVSRDRSEIEALAQARAERILSGQ